MLDSQLLAACGLTATEQQILLHLLKQGGSTAALVAKRLGIKRTTVYSALAALEESGIVLREKAGGATYYSTIDPQNIPKVFRSRAKVRFEEINSATDLLADQLKQYRRSTRHRMAGYEITTMESREAIYSQLLDILCGGDFCAIYDIETASLGPARKIIEEFLRQTAVTRPHIRDLVVDGPALKWYMRRVKNPNHEVKVLPAKYRIMTDFILSNNTVFLTNYHPGNEMAIQIKQQDYFDSLMTLFDLLWERV